MIRLPLWMYLSAALAISVGANLFQLHRAGIKSAEADHAVEMNEANGKIDQLEDTIELNQAIAGLKIADTTELIANLSEIAERGQRFKDRWRQAAAAPLPEGCGPGQARVDAVNAHLGAKP